MPNTRSLSLKELCELQREQRRLERPSFHSVVMLSMDSESGKRQRGSGMDTPLLQRNEVHSYSYESIYDRPLPCCGCGIGWFSFIFGFLIPLTWYYGTYLFFTDHYRRDPRERPGLAACAIAALVGTVAAVVTVISVMAESKGST